ncbi:Alpha/Beta hydrolase protein [Gautieria morchelliformis]|nr:Alpha/Beta hydrolase protein [Gautieria morchelliformis]
MHHLCPHTLLVVLLVVLLAAVVEAHIVRPFHVALSHGTSRMNDLVRNSRVPSALPSITTPASPTPGIDVQWLHALRKSWLEEFNWENRQDYMNSFNHYMTHVEGLDIHFVHAKSTAPPGTEVIPIILSHGWPVDAGSFLEFLPVVDTLTRSNTLKSGRNVSFDLVIPSLPGFAFSGPPPQVWTVNDTARVWNTLMVDVLGYKAGYSVAGTDWGAAINWCLLNEYPLARAAHFNFFAIIPPSLDILTSAGVQLSDFERSGAENGALFFQTGAAYFMVHQTRPWTLGLAMADSPMAQLAWIAEKYHDWSDPSKVDVTQILTTVSLYYLTESFPTSLYIYAQNVGFSSSDVKSNNDKPFGYSSFRWEGIRHPEAYLRGIGNLTYYKEHHHGGHFAPSEVPDVYANDVIEMIGANFRSTAGTPTSANIFNFGVQRHLQNILRPSF